MKAERVALDHLRSLLCLTMMLVTIVCELLDDFAFYKLRNVCNILFLQM